MNERQTIITRLAQRKNFTEIGVELGISRDSVRRRIHALIGDLASDEVDATHLEILRLEREKQEEESKNALLKTKLKALQREESIYRTLAQVIREETSPLPPIGDVRLPKREKGATPVDMVVLLSDEHADLVVTREASWGLERYDFNVFRARLQNLFELIRDYASVHLPRHDFRRLWVFKLGDGVNGDIHDAGPRNFFKNTLKAAIALGDVEAQFVQGLLPYFPDGVHVVGISGNHPRRTKVKDFSAPHDNYDYLVGVQMAARLADEIEAGRVSVTLPDSYTAYVEVRGRLWALNHGDDITSYTGLPWVGFDRRNNRVQTLVANADQRVDYFAAGHYHTAAEFASAGGRSYHSGTFMRVDPYALNKLALGGGPPVQHLYVQSDKRGIIASLPIYLVDEAREEMMEAGVWEPELGRNTSLDIVTPKPVEGLQIVRA
jgi:hypothetical protein